ncbi:MAG: HAD-IA family hydrolase [Chloroflexi bacterium]|nr:HAD-IA family hydrolase [Chloroflexota bacterium]
MSDFRSRYRAVFFDVGETLVYAHPSPAEIMAEICAESGLAVSAVQIEAAEAVVAPRILRRQTTGDLYSISPESSERFWRWVYLQILGELRPPDVPPEAQVELARRFHARFSAIETWRLYPDAIPALERVAPPRAAGGLVLGVISNWEDWLEVLLAHLEIDRYFDFSIVSANVRREKPDPAIFAAALERARVAPHEALHVGDSLHADVGGARAVGITPVLLDRRGRYTSERAGGAAIIRSLEELPPLLDR